MYIKRQQIKKFWPVPRKGTKYLSAPSHEITKAVPLVIVMRDVLRLVKTKKELKRLVNENKIMINGKIVKDVNYPLVVFDSLSFPHIKKYYRAILKRKKIGIEEIDEKKASNRAYKVVDKKQLKDKKIQLNLNNGKNIICDKKISTGDFVVLENNTNKIIENLSLGKGSEVIVMRGKHIGARGKIKDISEEGNNRIADIKRDDEEEIKVDVKNLFIMI
jgi:small subunit ribosomal protein S4e